MRNRFYTALLLCLVTAVGHAGPRDQARRIHDRLTGVPPTNEMLDVMTTAVASGEDGAVTAAFYAIDGAPGVAATGDFYTVTVKNWATPWTNEARDSFAPLNDYSATVVGIVRDEIDFRELLAGDIIYVGNAAGIPPYAANDNSHYEALERAGANLGDSDVLVGDSQSLVTGISAQGVAGVMTTRAAARAFFVDGTNRAMFRFTVLNHLCMDLEELKDTNRPSDRIRQDVSRSPGGDSSLFLNQCVGCHSGMDPMAQAFAYYDFPYPDAEARPGLSLDDRKDLGSMVYSAGVVQAKYGINSATFSPGYVTPNAHWSNYWRIGSNTSRIGWRNTPANSGSVDLVNDSRIAEGDGAASLGWELANSDAFAWCQVEKVFSAVCLREPAASADGEAMNQLVGTFNATHNIKQVFAEVAGYCSSHL